ncbi:MAG: phosphopantetheine-binding protein [Acutalibacteraceae bacterium]|nr:phosphopantetheine-binding protein [Acutalibacteraceae bacterium]
MVKKIEQIFSEVTGLTDLNFTEKTKFDKSLIVSSLAMIQLICALEDEFDIEIPNSEIKKFKKVKDVVKFLEKNAD